MAAHQDKNNEDLVQAVFTQSILYLVMLSWDLPPLLNPPHHHKFQEHQVKVSVFYCFKSFLIVPPTFSVSVSGGTLSKNSREYRTPPAVAPPQVPSHYAPNYPMGHPRRERGPGYSSLPVANAQTQPQVKSTSSI